MLISLCLVQSKYVRMHKKGILSIGHKVFEFFCMPVYTDGLSDLHKKFQTVSIYMKKMLNTKFGVSSLICFLDMLTTDIHRLPLKILFFRSRWTQNVWIHQNPNFKNLTQKQ